jgi:hypothetical protein
VQESSSCTLIVTTCETSKITSATATTADKPKHSWAKFKSENRGGSDKRRIVYCSVCVAYPDIVKVHCPRIPAICSTDGAVFRQILVDEHAISECHNACDTRRKQETAHAEGHRLEAETHLEKTLRFVNSQLEMKIAKIMISIYMDAKRGTLSAWSFPARYVASLIGQRLDLNAKHEPFQPSDTDLQYVTPHCHREMLVAIA